MSDPALHDRATSIASDIIDLIATSEDFRELIKADPERAMAEAGFTDHINELMDDIEAQEDEVSGFGSIAPGLGNFSRPQLNGTTIVASAFPSSGCCGASTAGQIRLNQLGPR